MRKTGELGRLIKLSCDCGSYQDGRGIEIYKPRAEYAAKNHKTDGMPLPGKIRHLKR